MIDINKLIRVIQDPFNGPFDGEDFWVEDDGIIQVPDNNVKMSSNIVRKVNQSNKFKQKLVNLGKKGDCIQLGFDELADQTPIFETNIGYKNSSKIAVRHDANEQCYVYVDGKRSNKVFKRLTQAKAYINRLDKVLKQSSDSLTKGYDDVSDED